MIPDFKALIERIGVKYLQMIQPRIDELKARLELLRREQGEVEVLINAYENAQKKQRENGKAEVEKVDA